jgi:hypothetical protein
LALLKASLVALLAGAGSEGPEYPLGALRTPPIADEATPFRLVDLRYAFTDDGETLSSFETRVRAGGSLFVGGEVIGDRRGLFVDTQRIELGVSEQNGSYEIEGSFRAPWFVVGTRALHEDGEWAVSGAGSIRFSNDVELLLSHSHDLDQSLFTPSPVKEFARSGMIPPPGQPSRELRGTSLGLLYQSENHLEALADARLSRVRTEAGFDLDVERYRLATLWNPDRFEIDGELSYERTSGRLATKDFTASLGIDAEVGSHVLARASTLQRWEPGVLRFEEDYRVGATFFGRRHRFARRSDASARILELQRKANALGYNERRVYDLEGLRRFRERLGLSPARLELKEALDELYRAQVRDRNVPQLGFELEIGEDSILSVERRGYRAFIGVPWPLRFPFLPDEDLVEFLLAELIIRHEDYAGGIRAVSREASLTAFLSREMSLAFRWQDLGITPQEVILERSRPSRFTVSFEYAMGR